MDGGLIAIGYVMPQIMFAWFTGVSRIIDNKHSTADVVGGFILGAMIGLAFVMKVPSPSPSIQAYTLSAVPVHGATDVNP